MTITYGSKTYTCDSAVLSGNKLVLYSGESPYIEIYNADMNIVSVIGGSITNTPSGSDTAGEVIPSVNEPEQGGEPDGTIEPGKTVTPSWDIQKVLPSAGYNSMRQVTVNAIPVTQENNSAGGVTLSI